MTREKNVLDFYMLCNKLKDIVRTGWKIWGVDRHRVESIAEHIYGVQMLAIAIWSEYKYDIDIMKVITMLAVHEMEETIIGDITYFQMSKEEKAKIGAEAVETVFKKLSNAGRIKELIVEFEERKTKEAKFAYFCDKLECDIQAKLYDAEHCVDLSKQDSNVEVKDKDVIDMLNNGYTWSDMWMTFGQKRYNYDENFLAISNYVKNNKV